MLDESLSWNEQIRIIKNKISKNTGITYKAKSFLTPSSLRSLYFSFIYSHYTTAVFKKLVNKQKQSLEIASDNRDTLETMTKLKVFNVYKFSLFQTLNRLFKFKNNLAPFLFSGRVKEIPHVYPARNICNSFTETRFRLYQSKFASSSRVPRILYKILNSQQKSETNEIHYKKSVKNMLLFLENSVKL